MRPGEEEELERQAKHLEVLAWQAKLDAAYNHRRQPRVRLRTGRRGLYVTCGTRRTKRAAFRAARRLRDEHGWRRPLRVWKDSESGWCYGSRVASLPSSGDTKQ